ncbi:hypothetical protein [Frondihabitans australicus]|uniref:Uncharacterized protein n=1 Tax=Frondihabitans australicus TaxID=386892 RepID=A0A495IEG8_9MICO|nr:hypothetical protein [Frondihabitans australicus]RKR74387.1 hypothetical protein C8E83_1499 [Frondihabitans australicus]
MTSSLILSSDLTSLHLDDRHLRRWVASGRLHRVRNGAFVSADDWAAMKPRARHVLEVHAMLRAHRGGADRGLVVSHASAAALWNLPTLDPPTGAVHVYDPARRAGRESATLVRHGCRSAPEATLYRGIVCTPPARTAVDVALADGFVGAVIVFEGTLASGLATREELSAALAARSGARGAPEARRALDFARDRAGSAGESLARAVIHELEFPAPVQQKPFPNPRGGSYHVDFWWEEFGLIGEFDGRQKYLDPAMRGRLSLEEVLLREKQRSDDLLARPEVRNLVRWKYSDARTPPILREILKSAGLPSGGRLHP